jgi:hypothetical protein
MWFYPKLKVEVQEQFNWKLRIIFRSKEVAYNKLNYKPISYSKKISQKEKNKLEKVKKKRDTERHQNSKKKQKRYLKFKEDLEQKWLLWKELHKEASRLAFSNTV